MPAVVFDVNETLLDLSALDPLFERHFGDAAVRREWFALVLHCAMAITATGGYEDFSTITVASLRALASQRHVDLHEAGVQEIVAGMRRLPAHPEVPRALARLRDGGLRLAALTNSPLPMADEQLVNAGVRHALEAVVSCSEVGRLKPAAEPYQMAAERLAIPIDEMVLVAAHGWDVAGAMAAGSRAIFVARPGQSLLPVGRHPEFVAADITGVADRLLGART
jgi:2-haloacid dehalogenase